MVECWVRILRDVARGAGPVKECRCVGRFCGLQRFRSGCGDGYFFPVGRTGHFRRSGADGHLFLGGRELSFRDSILRAAWRGYLWEADYALRTVGLRSAGVVGSRFVWSGVHPLGLGLRSGRFLRHGLRRCINVTEQACWDMNRGT